MININKLSFLKRLGILALFIFSAPALASVKVAFIEMHRPNGELVQLEEGGRFYHVAISYRGQWLQAHPYLGVVLSNSEELGHMGTIAEIITVPNLDELSDEVVNRYLHKPYDSSFSWDDSKIYCSELVAKILAIPPEPMYFSPKLWPASYQQYNGLPGISPDDIYRILRQRN